MSNNYFQFRQFLVRQDRCAMKVGTDGCLLGAWAHGGHRILDVGTGTGLLALMLAQRYPVALIDAIDIDPEAARQASDNVRLSPFADRISIQEADFNSYSARAPYDAIVSNPPYYPSPATSGRQLPRRDDCNQRSLARSTLALSFQQLMQRAALLLAPGGEVSVVVPAEGRGAMVGAAALAGLQLARSCAFLTSPRKPVRRYLLAFRRETTPQLKTTVLVLDSPEYCALLHDFYLKM